METTAVQQAERGSKRKRNFIILLIILLLAAGGGVAWYLLYARYYETTDDAYVNGNQVTLTPQIGGTVTQVTVDEGDFVQKGQPLVLLDPSDTEIALQQAEASLANTVRQVRGLYSTADNYRAQVAAKKSGVANGAKRLCAAAENLPERGDRRGRPGALPRCSHQRAKRSSGRSGSAAHQYGHGG